MDTESKLNSLGIDAVTGVNLLDWLQLAPEELTIPDRFAKLQSIISYLNPLSEDIQRYLIRRSTVGKQVDRLQHVFEYTNLLKQKAIIENEKSQIDIDKSAVVFDPIMSEEVRLREESNQKELAILLDEIRIYEK